MRPHHEFIALIYSILSKYMSADEATIHSENIAFACFDSAYYQAKENNIVIQWNNPQFTVIYGSKCNTMLSHIDPNSRVSGSVVIEHLRNGISAKELLKMPVQDLAPSVSAEIRKKIHEQSSVKVKEAVTNMHKCPKPTCGAYDANYEQKQVRAADEGSTLFLRCRKCNHTWKIN